MRQAIQLDGRRVTTHWAAAQELQAEYPALEVDPDPLYIRDGPVWTSAGVTAGIDLALALVADDLGDDTLDVVAERCGLGSAESLRRVFHRHLGISPDAYRRRFRTTTRSEGASA
jgi:transcriptional regulator GlxA family with amidase domain